MCGLWGVWGDGSLPSGISDSMHHRGPDDKGIFHCPTSQERAIILGHNRLSIIDLSDAGHQPMYRNKLAIVFGGEIYNARELARAHFPGERWRGSSDTEVLLALWEKYQEGCLQLLDGMFAFAVWNADTRILTLARDRAGEKPVYWTHQAGIFAFASELRALKHVPDLDWSIDETAFGEYMALRYVPAPRSIIAGIHKLQPGHVLTFDGKAVTTRRWYAWEVRPQPDAMASQTHFRATVDATEAALIESMRGRLISDRPLGMFLSGGIDSSLVCAIARKLGTTPRTFSIGFEGDAKSEHQRAAKTAQQLGCEHHEHIFSISDFEEVASNIGSKMDEPNGDRSCVPTYLLSQAAGASVRVAISGDGGDELFGGYGRFLGLPSASGAVYYYDQLLPVAGIAWAPQEAEIAQSLFTHPGRAGIHALRQLDFNRYLTLVLAKMDRMSMQHSLEVRTPYLSPAVLEIARTLPTTYLHQGNVGKLVLRELAARYIDRELAALPKRGFGMPASVFEKNTSLILSQNMDAVKFVLNMPFVKNSPICNRILDMPQNINSIWAIIVFAQWARSMGL